MKSVKFHFTLMLIFGLFQTALSQCIEDRHSTNLIDGWMSCTSSANPHSILGESHWIHYDLGFTYNIHAIKIWNLSHPSFVKSGIKDVIISSSLNGNNWIMIDTFSIPKGYYSGTYEGQLSIDLKGISARHLILTALSNHGASCVGFSEIKIHTQQFVNNELEFAVKLCENAGTYQNIFPGILPGGSFSGPGIKDNGDGSFDFDPDVTGPGRFTINYSNGSTVLEDEFTVLPCGHGECPDCENCATNDLLVINNSDIPSGTYIDKQILSAGQVLSNRDVDFRGAEQVELASGFEVINSSHFEAQIRECYANGVVNSSFENDWSSWYYNNNESANYTVNFSISEDDSFEGQKCAQAEVVDYNPSAWNVEIGQRNVIVEPNKSYRAIVRAKSQDAESFYIRIQQSVSPYTLFATEQRAHKPYWNEHIIDFTTDASTSGEIYIEVWIGSSAGTHLFDNIKVIEIE